MQVVSGTFTTKSESTNRRPQVKAEIDWDNSGQYSNETPYILSVEVERKINEPLGGIALAQADINLSNASDRFTP